VGGFGGGGGAGGFGGGGAAAGLGAGMTPGGYTSATEQVPGAKPEGTGGTAAAAASGSGSAQGGRGMGAGMMPMGGMMGGMGQDGGGDHKSRSRLVADPAEIFGKPEKASAPVIGDED
jgi:hypothetical protein